MTKKKYYKVNVDFRNTDTVYVEAENEKLAKLIALDSCNSSKINEEVYGYDLLEISKEEYENNC